MEIFGGLSGRQRTPARHPTAKAPLVVALHGGTYSSAYFDVPGYSLLDRASALGVPLVAPDRPGYVDSAKLPDGEGTIRGQARALTVALRDAWKRYGEGTQGIVLIGHSIGGAIAATIASEPEDLPIIGLAVSGVGMRTPTEHQDQWASLPNTPLVEMPLAAKDFLMFSPPGAFDASMPAASHVANTLCPRDELLDIVGAWHTVAPDVLRRITAPVHYRQAEFDQLWIVNQGEVDAFARALTHSSRVDAAMVRGTGHCMDFHYVGKALQIQQLGFALQCACESTTPTKAPT